MFSLLFWFSWFLSCARFRVLSLHISGHESNRNACGVGAPKLVALIDDADDTVSRNACGACANLLSQPDDAARQVVKVEYVRTAKTHQKMH
jgi:hypothetical protein